MCVCPLEMFLPGLNVYPGTVIEPVVRPKLDSKIGEHCVCVLCVCVCVFLCVCVFTCIVYTSVLPHKYMHVYNCVGANSMVHALYTCIYM